jgi:hypothetical protein
MDIIKFRLLASFKFRFGVCVGLGLLLVLNSGLGLR